MTEVVILHVVIVFMPEGNWNMLSSKIDVLWEFYLVYSHHATVFWSCRAQFFGTARWFIVYCVVLIGFFLNMIMLDGFQMKWGDSDVTLGVLGKGNRKEYTTDLFTAILGNGLAHAVVNKIAWGGWWSLHIHEAELSPISSIVRSFISSCKS
jgi:hypothetical protein